MAPVVSTSLSSLSLDFEEDDVLQHRKRQRFIVDEAMETGASSFGSGSDDDHDDNEEEEDDNNSNNDNNNDTTGAKRKRAPDTRKRWSKYTKTYYLTYAAAMNLTLERIKEHFIDNPPAKFTHRPVQYIIGQEKHKDGRAHFHVLLVYGEKWRTRNQSFFDLDGYHPNIGSAARSQQKHIRKIIAYCAKGGKYVTSPGLEIPANEEHKMTYGDILRGSHTAEEAQTKVIKHHPRDAALYLSNMRVNFNIIFPPAFKEYVSPYPPESWVPTREMLAWVENEFPKRGTVLIVYFRFSTVYQHKQIFQLHLRLVHPHLLFP